MNPRRGIAVMVSRFPLVTETFILRELIELERQGQPVLLVPMLKETPEVVHQEAKPWVERALDTPYLSVAILRANGRALVRMPLRYLGLLARLIAGSARSPGFFARTIAIFPKSVYLAEQLQAQGIRHVHAHFATHPSTMALIVSALTDIGFSISAHAHDIFVNRTMLAPKMRRAAFVRAISNFNREFLGARYPDAASKIAVIHVGIDPAVYSTGGSGLGTGDPVILCVAAFKPYKGLPLLVDACESLASEGVRFRCEIIGDGPLRPRIEDLIRTKNLTDRVQLLGSLPQHEVIKRMGQSSLVVLPSVIAPDGQMEGIPVALMEAMAAERPVVASALSGVPELVEHGVSGLLVEPGNAVALTGAIRQLLENPDLGREMGRRGGEKVRAEFVLSATVAQLIRKLDQFNDPAEISPDEMQLLGDPHSIGVRRTHEREDSRVVEVLVDGRELIVKTQKSRVGESRPPLQRAGYEFGILQQLSAVGLAPRPIRLAGASIVLERARGKSLDRLIRELRNTPEALVPAFHAVGNWLREFQTVIPNACHGDLWPGNIFISRDGVQVIDFEGLRHGEQGRDLTNFLAESQKFFSRLHSGGRFVILRDAFRSGYERAGRG